jgi:hypothetical protein
MVAPVCTNPFCQNTAAYEKGEFYQYCSRACAYSDPNHKEKLSAGKKRSYQQGRSTVWNKGRSAETDARVKEISEKSSATQREQFNSGKRTAWNRGLNKENDERVAKQSATINARSEDEWNQINAKRTTTVKEKYGVENVFQLEEIKDKSKQTLLLKYGEYHPSRIPEIRKKIEQTNLERYGVKSLLEISTIRKKGYDALVEKYGGYFSESEEFQKRKEEIFAKMRTTNKKRYGFESASKNPLVQEKRINTLLERYGVSSPAFLYEVQRKRKRSFHDKAWEKRKNSYPNLTEEDLYLLEENYRIEVAFYSEVSVREYPESVNKKNLSRNKQNHLDHRFSVSQGFLNHVDPVIIGSPGNLELLSSRANHAKRDKCSITIDEAVEESKRIFSESQADRTLDILYPNTEIGRELLRHRDKDGNYAAAVNNNKIVLTYQPHFYEKEKALWQNPNIRGRLLWNRYLYLRKFPFELSNAELLRGFKISGLHYGFSHFSPLWLKAFVEEFGVESIYDPCGGWGHRALGAQGLDHYIYNDVDERTVEGVKRMTRDLELNNVTCYNRPAESFRPQENYQAVFTCPPYWNKELYTNPRTSTALYHSYEQWLTEWWAAVVRNAVKPGVRYFAFATHPELVEDMSRVVEETTGGSRVKVQPLGPGSRSHFQAERSSRDVLVAVAI